MIEGIKLSYEVADSITLATLNNSKKSIQEDINRLLELSKLEEHDRINLKNDLQIISHITAVIDYYEYIR